MATTVTDSQPLHNLYYIPEKYKEKLKELTNVKISPEERLRLYEDFVRKFMNSTPDELSEIGKEVWKRRKKEAEESDLAVN